MGKMISFIQFKSLSRYQLNTMALTMETKLSAIIHMVFGSDLQFTAQQQKSASLSLLTIGHFKYLFYFCLSLECTSVYSFLLFHY